MIGHETFTLSEHSAADDVRPIPERREPSGPLMLREHATVDDVRLTPKQASALNGLGGGRYLSVVPTDAPDRWQVTARNYVGSVNVAGLQVLVRPKIPMRNLFLLLEVGLRERDWRDEAALFETTGDLLPALLSFFARTTETTLARGLYHSYQDRNDLLVALRGRVDIARQFTCPGAAVPTACRFTEFTADVIENTYLKTAVARSLRVTGVPAIDRRRLMQHLVALEEASDVHHRHDDYDRMAFTRLNDHYRPALRLARLILANLTLQDVIGRTPASSFMLDMNELFERFVTERLRRTLRGRLHVKDQHRGTLDRRGDVRIRPDLVFTVAGNAVFVADIKYKPIDTDTTAHNADHYQLLAYTTALDTPEGVLIYCLDTADPANTTTDSASTTADSANTTADSANTTADSANTTADPANTTEDPANTTVRPADSQPRPVAAVSSVQVRHTDKVLHTYPLDLSGDPDSVTRNMKDLADWIHSRATASAYQV